MKLCRFELNEQPGESRSGIYYEGKFYETDGEQAIAIHESDAGKLLMPLIAAPSVRLFTTSDEGSDSTHSAYRFLNPSRLYGPNRVLALPDEPAGYDLTATVAAISAGDGAFVQPEEAPGFVLGYALLLVLRAPAVQDRLEPLGLPDGAAHDVGLFLGPVITTPDELADLSDTGEPTSFVWDYRLKLNGEQVAAGEERIGPYGDCFVEATRFGPVRGGEVLGGPPLVNSLSGSGFSVSAGDIIEFEVQRLGRLVARIESA
ncbi:MAG: fumarylacetoacetate hydrolase family protein [Fimbriimonadaceae bacterium]|nr:fumarylacetoacetate hydrolase family protein [Fimbriimonadaceae bacterium]